MQDSDHTTSTSRFTNAKNKRKGKVLGTEANNNLERLLMEDNIQGMLEHELQDNELFNLVTNRQGK